MENSGPAWTMQKTLSQKANQEVPEGNYITGCLKTSVVKMNGAPAWGRVLNVYVTEARMPTVQNS